VGLVLVTGESRGGGETAERETERDSIVWDWYWSLGRAAVGVRQKRERQSEMVLCGTGTGHWVQQGGERAVREKERDCIVWDWYWSLGRAGVVVRQQ